MEADEKTVCTFSLRKEQSMKIDRFEMERHMKRNLLAARGDNIVVHVSKEREARIELIEQCVYLGVCSLLSIPFHHS